MLRLLPLLLIATLQAADGYQVTVDAKPWAGQWIELGDGPHPGPGDLLWVDGWRIPVDGPGNYSFSHDGSTLKLSRDGAPATLVAASIGTQWKESAEELANPLAGRPPAELATLRSLRFTSTRMDGKPIWTTELLDPAQLDWQHLFLELRLDFGSPTQPLPDLAARQVRMLAVESGSSGGGFSFDLTSLATGGTLVYADLEAGGAAPIRGAWLASHGGLRHLAIRSGSLTDAAPLASLRALRTLSLDWFDEPLDLAFATRLVELRSAAFRRSAVASLAPLIGLPRLESIDASASPVAVLPAEGCTALRRLDVIGTHLDAAAVAAFAKRNPLVRINHRWTDGLRAMAADADQLILRTGGTCHRNTAGERVLHQTNDREAIALLVAGIEIDEGGSGNSCMCCGSCALEFRRGETLLATLGMHHGFGLRWSGQDDPWPGDARLTDAAAGMLCAWIAAHGDDGPLQERNEMIARDAAGRRMWAHYQDILGEAASARLAQLRKREEVAPLLAERWPDASDRLIALLRLYGCGHRSWSGMYGLDELIEGDAAPEAAAVVALAPVAMAQPDACDGLARWAFGLGRIADLTAEQRLAIGPRLAARALADPRADNRRSTLIRLDACADAWATEALRLALTGIPARELAPAELHEPGGQVVYRPRPWSPPDKAGDRAVAALALARRSDAISLDAIRALAQQSAGDDRAALDQAVQLFAQPGSKPAP